MAWNGICLTYLFRVDFFYFLLNDNNTMKLLRQIAFLPGAAALNMITLSILISIDLLLQ